MAEGGPARRPLRGRRVPAPARPASATATAVSWPRYAGTSGRTHGLTGSSGAPPPRATRIVRLSPLTRGSRRGRRRGTGGAWRARSRARSGGPRAPRPGSWRRTAAPRPDRSRCRARGGPRCRLAPRGTVLEQALDDRAGLVAQMAAVAGVQDQVGEGSRHRSLHSRVGRDPRTLGGGRCGPSTLSVTFDRHWTSERVAPDDACRRRANPPVTARDRGDGRLRSDLDPGAQSPPAATRQAGLPVRARLRPDRASSASRRPSAVSPSSTTARRDGSCPASRPPASTSAG